MQNQREIYAVRLADDALIHAQRLTQWTSHAPSLEEDLALANVALDYLGRARFFYAYAGAISGLDEDDYAFSRSEREFTNLLLVELPNGDFARTLVRQYLIDEFQALYLDQLQSSEDPELAAIAAKISKETEYHLRRSSQWMQRFGLGTSESRQRTNQALSELWGYMPEYFVMDEVEQDLLTAGIAVDRMALHEDWYKNVYRTLVASELMVPEEDWHVVGGRSGIHTEHMGHLLAEMQYLQRAYPGLTW